MTINDDHEIDHVLRQTLRSNDPAFDPARLIARVQQRLPAEPPTVAAGRMAADRSVRRLAGLSMLAAALALVALVNIAGVRVDMPPDPLALPGSPASAILRPSMELFRAEEPFYRTLVGLTIAVIGVMLSTGVLGVYPQRSTTTARMLLDAPVRSIMQGIVASLLLLPLVLGSMLLPFWAVPITFLIQLPFIIGIAVIGRSIALRPGFADRPAMLAPATIALLAVLITPVAVAAALLPWWWVLLLDLLAIPGLGALIVSRGGTRVHHARLD